MTEGFLRLTRKWPESVAVATLRDIDAVSHKKHRLACKQINQCFFRKINGNLLRLQCIFGVVGNVSFTDKWDLEYN